MHQIDISMTTNTTEYRIYIPRLHENYIWTCMVYAISCQMIQQALGALVYTISLSLSLSLNVYPFNLYKRARTTNGEIGPVACQKYET